MSALRLDFLSQPKYLLPGVNIRIRLTKSRPDFCLHLGEGKAVIKDAKFKVNITSAILYVRRVKVSPSVELGHSVGLKTKNAIYPYTRTKTVSYSIPAGSSSFIKENLFSTGLLPKFIVVGMLHGQAYSGSLLKKPFNFQHFGVQHISLHRDGQILPYKRAYSPNFGAKKLYTDVYVRSILHNTQLLNTNHDSGITMDDFANNGYCFFTFNLTPDFDMTQAQVDRDSNLRLDVRFNKAMDHAINVVAYATYDAKIQITKDREIITDAHT